MASFLFIKSFNKLFINKSVYHFSKHSISYLLTKLNDRKLIRINGKDSYDYIQGLVTNDIRHLEPTLETSVTLDCIHSFMLSVLGRVVSDVFIYKTKPEELILEIDSHLLNSMTKFLKAYKVRRKVSIDIENDLEVWSVFPSKLPLLEQIVVHKNDIQESYTKIEDLKNEDIFVVRDPRLKELGFRLLVKTCNNDNKEIKSLFTSKSIELSETDVNDYHRYRYQLGIGEGVKDFPVEACFPLECNADYLHGVSFHKGCYVGQELTARIYHTGVIRKRLMPIEIISDNQICESIPIQSIQTDSGKTLGKFRSNLGKYGLALLKFEDVVKADKLSLSQTGLTIKAWIPFWWPKEVNRESIPCGRDIH